MNRKYPFIILFFLLMVSLYGQGTTTIDILPGFSGLELTGNSLNFIGQQEQSVEFNTISSDKNNIFIIQAGSNNSTEVQSRTNNSEIITRQIGSHNRIRLSLTAEKIDYQALQTGNNNMLLEFNNQPNRDFIQREIQQNGNNQNLVIHGNNALADKLKVKMQNSGQSLIIRHFN